MTPPAARPRSNRELAEQAYAALAAHDFEGFCDCVDPDAEFTSLVAEAEGVTYHGHAGVREWWDEVTTAVGGLDLRLEDVRELGAYAIVRVRVGGTVGGTELSQTMWQAGESVDGLLVWWGTFRTEEEALAAIEARSARAP